ncbi:putative cysteine and glycine-rich protein 2 binding protein [Operophtera brumata]|uniref:Putative cysteine and glycine-rich protein 2 binding protein n=1 Tax=Operophtera brumata TaxID=104452 RepID=A0A0L7L6Q5_OPEBR|nr:putative cysteine and glycine-rich protein 2 binding protein [Operophtera brumata]
MSTTCKYCNEAEDKQNRPGLLCYGCMNFVHLACLRRPGTPGDFACDVFFEYTCESCSQDKLESFVRYKIPWVNVIYLTLNHLCAQSYGISHHGYFHYKTHICSFIDRYWQPLFGASIKQKKNWVGTIAGVLSIYNKLFFKSGSTVLGEMGWWRLLHNFSPAVAAHIIQEMARDKPKNRPRNQLAMDRNHFVAKICEMEIQLLKQVEGLIPKYLMDNLCGTISRPQTGTTLLSRVPPAPLRSAYSGALLRPYIRRDADSHPTWLALTDELLRRTHRPAPPSSRGCPPRRCAPPTRGPSCGPISGGTLTRTPPGSRSRTSCCDGRTGKTGTALLSRVPPAPLRSAYSGALLRPYIRRDAEPHPTWLALTDELLRRTHRVPPAPLRSAYSGALLRPYIRRDADSHPTWLALTDELLRRTHRHVPDYAPPPRATIDYSYVRAEHIAAVNMTEALQYPEFSCVASYKRLAVGCAFLVPDSNRNEAYISFILTRPEWRRAGIATFMLYHLLQTCTGKDVTLHCSPTNPSIFLYQKFGFKVEELVQDFYEKYFDIEYKGCRHALFLRLAR